MTTDQKGNLAEAAVVFAAVKLHLGVYRPVTEGERCDLILNTGRCLLRVQCKWAALCGEVLIIRRSSARRGIGARIVNRPYTTSEVDAFAAYSADLEKLLPPAARAVGEPADGAAARLVHAKQPAAGHPLGERLRIRG